MRTAWNRESISFHLPIEPLLGAVRAKLRSACLRLSWMMLTAVVIPATSFALEFPVLLYHRFGPQMTDSTTVRTDVFESQLREIEQRGYRVAPLRQLVDHLVAHAPPPPPHSVAITVDDGHRSVYTELLPVVLRHRIPVTLFIYPSAISNASYAMTWQQLQELHATGLFDIQSHTYWHANFKREKRRLSPVAYRRFVDMQLRKSKQTLEEHVGAPVSMLAWPYGLYDRELEEYARQAGYVAAFSMEGRAARGNDNPLAIPRYFINSTVSAHAFKAILDAARNDAKERR